MKIKCSVKFQEQKKSSTDSLSLSMRRSSVLAKTIVRDRTRPTASFVVNQSPPEVPPADPISPPQRKTPSPQAPPHDAGEVLESGSPLPPWAPAMAAIGAASRHVDHRPAF